MATDFSITSFNADYFAGFLQSMAPDFCPGAEAVRVVVTDSYLNSGLGEWNRIAVTEGIAWLLVRASWVQPWVGPLFHPQGACYACLASRLQSNAHVDGFIARDQPDFPRGWRPEARWAPLMAAAGAFVRLQLSLRWTPGSDLGDTIAQLDLLTHQCGVHRVVKRPQCPVCGTRRVGAAGPIVLEDHLYVHAWGGERRAAPPSETWRRHRHHISPISGVVTSLVSKTDPADATLHSYAAGHGFPVMAGNLSELRGNLRHRSGGKGTTALHARVGALCEAIERYSGLWQGNEPTVQGTYSHLSPWALEINEILCFSRRQYDQRRRWNRTCATNFQLIPEPLDPDLEVAWVKVWSLNSGHFRWVPAAYCYYGQRDLAHFFCACDSNGNAAGNTREEAILRGFMELVERDAVAIWWYNRLRMPGLDLASFNDPDLSGLPACHAALGRQLWGLDLTGDLGIPVAAVISRCVDRPSEDIVIGFSADLDMGTALVRAANEVGQFLPALSRRDAAGRTRYFYDDQSAIAWWQTARLADHPYLLPAEGSMHRHDPGASLADSNQRREVETCMALAAARGIDILVLDQTRPDIGLPVVKVIAPGMRHFWNRLGPGRLYEVPVRLGLLEAPTPEEKMNPIPMFF